MIAEAVCTRDVDVVRRRVCDKCKTLAVTREFQVTTEDVWWTAHAPPEWRGQKKRAWVGDPAVERAWVRVWRALYGRDPTMAEMREKFPGMPRYTMTRRRQEA